MVAKQMPTATPKLMATAVRRTLFIALTILARSKTIVRNQYITALQNVGKRFPIFIITGEHLVVSGLVVYVALWHFVDLASKAANGMEPDI